MHPKFEPADKLSYEAIGAAIEVHRILGPGLIESVYETCLIHELELRGICVEQQRFVDIVYKKLIRQHELKFDLLLEGCLLLELKACAEIPNIYKAKLLSYMKLLDVPIGLIINFHVEQLKTGITRMILKGANSAECVNEAKSLYLPQAYVQPDCWLRVCMPSHLYVRRKPTTAPRPL